MSSSVLPGVIDDQLRPFYTQRWRLAAQLTCWGLRLGLAGVFIAAAVHKVIDPASFAAAIHRFDLLPDVMVQPGAIVLPWIEVVAALSLLAPHAWRQAGAWLLLGLLGVFTSAVAWAWWRGLDTSCGCFGSDNPTPISGWLFLRNAGLGAAVLVLLWMDERIHAPADMRA